MLLSMVGFLATLIIVGGLASLVTPPDHSALTRYLSFTFLLGGLGGLSLSFGLAWLGTALHSSDLGDVGFFVGYGLGLLGGSTIGFFSANDKQ